MNVNEKLLTTPTRAAAYCRVSTQEQATEGISLAAQEAALRAYAAMRRLDLVAVIIDAGVSAGRPLCERQGGRRLLELVETGEAQAVLCYKLDRLFRDCADCLTVTRSWDQRGVSLHLVDMGGQAIDTSSAMGRFFLTIMAGAAEMERNLIRERTTSAMAHLRNEGVRLGGEALGWSRTSALDEDGRQLVIDVEAELATVQRIRELRAEGLSLVEIADRLTVEERPTKRGGKWYGSTVRAVLTRSAA